MRAFIISFGFMSLVFGTAGIAFYSDGVIPNFRGEKTLREGQLYLEQNNARSLNEALTRFTSLVAEFGNNRLGQEGKYHLAVAYTKMGFKREAYLKFRSLYFNKGLYSEDLRDRVNFQLGKLQIIQNLADEGLARFYKLLRSTEDHNLRAEIYTELGNYYYRSGNHQKARDSYELALMENPMLEKARTGLSRAYGVLGKDFAGYAVYDSYLQGKANLSKNKPKIQSEYAGSALAKGKALYKQGKVNKANYYEAIKHLQVARQAGLGTKVEDQASLLIGLCFLAVGDYHVARTYFEQVRNNSIEAYDAEALYYLALLHFNTKKYAQSASLFKQFMEDYPKHPFYDKALGYYNEATQLLQLESGFIEDETVTDNDVQVIDGEDEDAYLDDFENTMPGPGKPTDDYMVKGQKSKSVADPDLEPVDEEEGKKKNIASDEAISGF